MDENCAFFFKEKGVNLSRAEYSNRFPISLSLSQ